MLNCFFATALNVILVVVAFGTTVIAPAAGVGLWYDHLDAHDSPFAFVPFVAGFVYYVSLVSLFFCLMGAGAGH